MTDPHTKAKMERGAAEAQVTKLFDEQEIAVRVEELARMAMDRLLDNFVIVGLLVGSFVFVADFIRALHRLGCNPGVEFNQAEQLWPWAREFGYPAPHRRD